MIATKKEEGKRSEKKLEGNDDLRTIESLRGRLLAERQASRAANEEAERFGCKLVELENQLKEEIKMRKKAEKNLNLLKKKLESLKILPVLEESEQSSTTSSEIYSHSRRSSTTTTISGPKDSSEESESKSQITSPVISENLDCNVSDSPTSKQTQQTPSIQDDSDSLQTSNSSIKDLPHEKPSSTSQDSNTNETPSSSTPSMKTSEENHSEEEGDYVDNSLALVPVSYPEKPQKNTGELKITSASVGEVLDALRHAREKIRSSMERRSHMIRVGPC